MLGDVLGEGQLDEDAVNAGVVVVGVERVQQLGLGDVFGELDELTVDVGLSPRSVVWFESEGGAHLPLRRP